jgi:hypothetical protein
LLRDFCEEGNGRLKWAAWTSPDSRRDGDATIADDKII